MGRRAIGYIALVLAGTSAGVAGPREAPGYPHATPSWELELASPVCWQRVTQLGHLLVQTEAALHGVDPAIGRVAWTRTGLADLDVSRCSEISDTPVFVCRDVGSSSDVVVFESLGGKIVFDSRKIAPAKLVGFWTLPRADGLLVLTEHDAANRATLTLHELARGDVRWRRELPVPLAGRAVAEPLELSGSLLFASTGGLLRLDTKIGSILWRASGVAPGELGRFLTRGDDDPVFVYAAEHRTGASTTSVFSAHDVASGSPVWPRPFYIPGPLETAFFVEHGLVVGSAGPPHTIRLLDLASGVSVWGEAGQGIPIPGALTGHELSRAGLIVITATESGERDAYRLNVLDPATGAPRFERFVGMHGRIRGTELVEQGMLVVTTSGASILDTDSGLAVAETQLPTKGALLAPSPDGGWFAFSPAEGALYRLDPGSSPMRISRERVSLGTDAAQRGIEVYRDVVLVRSAQRLASFGRTGELLYQVHYPAPKDPALRAPLDEALRVTQSLQPSVPRNERTLGRTLPARYRHLLAQRAKASTAEVQHLYMLVELGPRRAALARVSKESGEIVDRIDLEGRPWQFDPVAQRVFRLDGSRRIVAFGS